MFGSSIKTLILLVVTVTLNILPPLSGPRKLPPPAPVHEVVPPPPPQPAAPVAALSVGQQYALDGGAVFASKQGGPLTQPRFAGACFTVKSIAGTGDMQWYELEFGGTTLWSETKKLESSGVGDCNEIRERLRRDARVRGETIAADAEYSIDAQSLHPKAQDGTSDTESVAADGTAAPALPLPDDLANTTWTLDTSLLGSLTIQFLGNGELLAQRQESQRRIHGTWHRVENTVTLSINDRPIALNIENGQLTYHGNTVTRIR